jgi:LPXTG-motif cell wall-anchored protein
VPSFTRFTISALVVAAAGFGVALPAAAQDTTTTTSSGELSPYTTESTPTTPGELTPYTPPPTTTTPTTTPNPTGDDGEPTTTSGSPVTVTGGGTKKPPAVNVKPSRSSGTRTPASTVALTAGSADATPSTLARTGFDPVLVGLFGLVLMLGAVALQRRRRRHG